MDRQHDDTRPCRTCRSPRHGTGAHEKLVDAFRHAYAPLVVPTFWDAALPAVKVNLVRGSSIERMSGTVTLHTDGDPRLPTREVSYLVVRLEGAMGLAAFLTDDEPTTVEFVVR